MSAGLLPAGCLCLCSGAILGGLFLALKLLRLLIRGGKLCTAIFDLLFCLVCAVVGFLCALAVDKGRLRFFQVLLQSLGAWGVIVSLDPLVKGGAARVRQAICWLRGFFKRRLWQPVKRCLGRLGDMVWKAARKILPKKKVVPARRRVKKRRAPGRAKRKRAAWQNSQSRGQKAGIERELSSTTLQSRK